MLREVWLLLILVATPPYFPYLATSSHLVQTKGARSNKSIPVKNTGRYYSTVNDNHRQDPGLNP
jgi:hypothetical protein